MSEKTRGHITLTTTEEDGTTTTYDVPLGDDGRVTFFVKMPPETHDSRPDP